MTAAANSSAVLLDTCAVIWLANGDSMSDVALTAIVKAGLSAAIYVSVASAWEIGVLSNPRSGGYQALHFVPDAKTWFMRFAAGPGIKLTPITPEIAIDASYLPAPFHCDPGDRLLVATARHMGVPIVTRDQTILDYAQGGHIQTINC